jgi:hypothetical protein
MTYQVRVILGGLLAGVLINVVEYINNRVILKNAWAQGIQLLGKPAAFSAGATVMLNISGLLLGIAAVWI